MDAVSLDTDPSSASRNLTEEEQIRIAFYRSYDVMTGIRIAATLGGFFGLMVILVVYKSKSKTEKVLTDPKLAAAVVEAEEERQLNAAFEASIEYRCLNPRGARRSLGNASAPCGRYTRFSSVGDRDSLLVPVASARPGVVQFDQQERYTWLNWNAPVRPQHRFLLDVPNSSSSRRPSNNTVTSFSSSDSSYLERRDSAVVLDPPVHLQCTRRRTSSPVPWRQPYPIDIRVIQPTPGGSPCTSERTLHSPPPNRLAPLASISSCASSLAVDYPDLEDARSFGSDSVFLDDEECLDTDDEVTQFSTDSDSDDTLSGSGECPVPLADLCRKSATDVEEGSWSQETLF